MVYGPTFSKTDFKGGKNILASEHFQNIEGGATLDHTKFDKGYNGVGKVIARNKDTGKFEPYEEPDGEGDDGFDDYAVLHVDFDNSAEQDLIAGEALTRGSVYEDKMADDVPTSFKQKMPTVRFVTHIKG